MYNEKRALFLTALTPMHAGSGSDLSVVDLPIQRESHTGIPKIEASTLKGCIRNAVVSFGGKMQMSSEICKQIFGSEGENEISAASAVLTDARLLFFPVRSAKGVFALITCPLVLQRFVSDMKRAGIHIASFLPLKVPVVPVESTLSFMNGGTHDMVVLLDEFLYSVTQEVVRGPFSNFLKKVQEFLPKDQETSNWLFEKAIIIPDDDFVDFVKQSTEIATRIAINDSGIVKDHALFTEEYLPTESIFYTLLMVGDAKKQPGRDTMLKEAKDLMGKLENCFPRIFQIGADLTLGKGFVSCKIVKGNAGDEYDA